MCIMLMFVLLTAFTMESVEAMIEFTLEPESQAVLFGQNIVLNCAATDLSDITGTLTYAWYHNGNQLTTSIFSNHSLLIVDIQNGNLGNYTCHVTNLNGTTTAVSSSTAVLIQAFIKPFATNPSPIIITEGGVATLECLTGESAPPPQIRWEKDGVPVSTGTQYKARFGTHPYDMIGQYYMQLVLDSKPKETGSYSCVAYNPVLGIDVKSVEVRVTIEAIESQPYVDSDITQNSTLLSPQGQPLILHCGIDGFPKPIITWYKQQDIIVPDTRVKVLTNGSLYFIVLTTGDQGYYYCDGKNYLGQARSADIFVQVAYIDLLFQQEPESLYITAGQPAVLHCTPPISYPPANVTWYKNNQPMMYRTGSDAVYIADPDNSIWDLFFTDIQKQDEGRYFCVASNSFAVPTSRTSKSADLQIGGAPVFIDPPISTSVVKGEGVEISCMVGGDPFPDITWLLDGIVVVPDKTLIMRNQNQELHMANVNKIREGTYTCRATNIYGTAQLTAFLKVLVPPVIVDFTQEVSVTAGNQLVIPCSVSGDPTPTVQWLKATFHVDFPFDGKGSHRELLTLADGNEIFPDDRIVINTDELVVKEAELLDAGIYTCHAFNVAGSVVFMATVIVNMKPEFIKSPFDKTVVIGKSVTMECEVKGHPKPIFTWLFNGTNLLPSGTSVSNENNVLSVAMVTWKHVGTYTCLASNALGSVTKDGKLSVYVVPRVQAINGDPVVYEGHDLELSCDVSGIPSPSIKWLHLGEGMVPSLDGRVSFPQPHKLLISYVQMSDKGEYKCVAENLAGKTELSILVSVIEPPLPPILKSAVSFTSTSMTLTWSPSTQKPNTLVSQFVVYHKSIVEADYIRYSKTADSTETQITVTDLTPGTNYMFVVSAVNPAGEGQQSNIINAKTVNSGPSPPRNLQSVFTNSSVVTLEWEIPAQTNGQITKYEIWYKIKETSDLLSLVTSENVHKPLLTFIVHNLEPFTLYEFKVRGATGEGGEDMWGELSNSIEVKTSAAAPYAVPVIDIVNVLSSRMVEIRWQQPPEETWNGENLKYRVTSTELNFTSFSTLYTTTKLFILIDDLLPWRWYSFVLEIGNEAGWALQKSKESVAHTLSEAPSAPPSVISVKALANQQVDIDIQLPDKSTWNSELTGVVVHYTDGQTSQTDYINDPDVTSITIRQLKPWTEYRLRLALYTESVVNGTGPFTDWKFIRTTESAPGVIRDVNHENTPTSILLRWTPPSQPNGIIQYYVVLYQDMGPTGHTTTKSDLRSSQTTEDTLVLSSSDNNVNRIQTNTTTAVLGNLSPSHVYSISIMAVNGAQVGERFNFTASTGSLPPQPIETTTEEVMTTEVTTGIQLQAKGYNSVLTPAIFGGILAGAILVVMVFILVTCLCIKRKRQDQARYVNTKNPEVFGNISDEHSIRNSKSLPEETGSLRRIDFSGDHVQYGTNKAGQDNYVVQTLEVPGTKLISKSSSLSRNSFNGIENPGYDQAKFNDTESIAVSMTLSSEDLFSQPASSFKRTSRMRSESAAAIAVMRNQRLPRLARSMDDTDNLLNHDSVVIYTERTAL